MVYNATNKLPPGIWLTLVLLAASGGCARITTAELRHWHDRALERSNSGEGAVQTVCCEYHPTCWRPWPGCQPFQSYPVNEMIPPGAVSDPVAHPETLFPPPPPLPQEVLPPVPRPPDSTIIPDQTSMPNHGEAEGFAEATDGLSKGEKAEPGLIPSSKEGRAGDALMPIGKVDRRLLEVSRNSETMRAPGRILRHPKLTDTVGARERFGLISTAYFPRTLGSPSQISHDKVEYSRDNRPHMASQRRDQTAELAPCERGAPTLHTVSEAVVFSELSPADASSDGDAWTPSKPRAVLDR